MKNLILITFLIINLKSLSQTNPQIIFASPERIEGFAEIGSTIEISTDSDFTSEHQITVNNKGEFKFSFPSLMTVGDNIIVWSVGTNQNISQRILVKIEHPNSILQNLNDNLLRNHDFKNAVATGRTVKYKVTIWNTNFSIPLARFNFTKNTTQKAGDLMLFNSIGAGFGISAGELSETRDLQGHIVNQEFINTFGIHLGFLFSAGTGDDTNNVFAPTLNFSVLDFQIGIGYELGTLSENQRATFLTLSYAIPLYKLKKGGFWIWKNAKPITNPNQSRLGE